MLGGATPTIVPFNRLGAAGAAPAIGTPDPIGGASAVNPPPEGGTGAAGAGAGAAAGAAPGAPGRGGPPCMSIVPLNFGAALFSWYPHVPHVCAVSVLLAPQFGQNTPQYLRERRRAAAYSQTTLNVEQSRA
jgi:hypothetical protein